MKHRIFLLFMFLLLLAGCRESDKTEITISAAASLRITLEELKHEFEQEHPDIEVYYNFGSSGGLQQQIIQGAPVDLFISASKGKMNNLLERGLIKEEYSKDILQNSLVLIARAGAKLSISTFEQLSENKDVTLAIGIPETVPAGSYAKEMLASHGIWKKVQNQLVYGKDVRQVLSYVESGNADFGIVYITDALATTDIQIIAVVEEHLHSPILYTIGIVDYTKNVIASQKYFRFLQSKSAIDRFERDGFKGLNEDG